MNRVVHLHGSVDVGFILEFHIAKSSALLVPVLSNNSGASDSSAVLEKGFQISIFDTPREIADEQSGASLWLLAQSSASRGSCITSLSSLRAASVFTNTNGSLHHNAAIQFQSALASVNCGKTNEGHSLWSSGSVDRGDGNGLDFTALTEVIRNPPTWRRKKCWKRKSPVRFHAIHEISRSFLLASSLRL